VARADGLRPRWLVQLGQARQRRPRQRGDNPLEWQQVAIGDRLLATPGDGAWFEAVALEPERFLALRAPVDLGNSGRSFDTALPRPRIFSDSTWCFLLTDVPGGRTRLGVSGYACSAPRPLTKLADLLVPEPAHWIM
jgi:hypothetical protein